MVSELGMCGSGLSAISGAFGDAVRCGSLGLKDALRVWHRLTSLTDGKRGPKEVEELHGGGWGSEHAEQLKHPQVELQERAESENSSEDTGESRIEAKRDDRG